MYICRLRYEALRSLSRATQCRHPEVLRRDSFARNCLPPAAQTSPFERREFTTIEVKRHQLAKVEAAPQHVPTQTAQQEEELWKADPQIQDDLPSLGELLGVEAELFKRLESELRQAVDEGDLELKDILDDICESNVHKQPTHQRNSNHDGLFNALLSPGVLETSQQAHLDFSLSLADQTVAHNVLYLFSQAVQVPGYLRGLQSERLQEILACITPEKVLKPYIALHRNLHPASVDFYGLKQLEVIFAKYYKLMDLLLPQAAKTLGQDRAWVLGGLMKICAECGMAKEARMLLAEVQRLPGHEVTLGTINDYLRAICWDDAFGGKERWNLRVTSKTKALRDSERGTRTTGYRTGIRGLKDEVLTTINWMKEKSLVPNAESYSSLLVALGREGLMDDVKALLKRIWDVDCDRLMGNESMDSLLGNKMSESSPKYPGPNVLAAVAHVFSINSDIASAMRILDLFSLKYHIDIPRDVWVDVLEGTHSLAARRSSRTSTQEQKAARLPLRSVNSLWEIMKSPQYGVPISMHILRLLLASCIRRDAKNEMVQLMLVGDDFALSSREAARKASEMRTIKAEAGVTSQDHILDDIHAVHAAHDHNIMVDALKHLLGGGITRRFMRAPPQPVHEWFYKTIPDLLARFSAYRVEIGNAYDTPTGRIQFHLAKKFQPRMTLRVNRPVTEGLSVIQRMPTRHIKVWVTMSRQVGLQTRYQKQGQLGKIPKWTPRWHETSEVRDWDREGVS